MAATATSEVLASTTLQTCSEQLATLISKTVTISPAALHDLKKWQNGQIPAKWVCADMAFEGDLKGQIYLAMEEKPSFALSALLRDMPASTIKERLSSIALNDSDIDAMREVANILSGALDDTLRNATGKKLHLKLAKFDVASKIAPHPDAQRIAFLSTMDIDGGLSKGSIALVFPANLAEFLGVEASTAAPSAAPVAGSSAPTAQAPLPVNETQDSKSLPWWKATAPRASSLVILGKGHAAEKAAAICEVVKIPCQRPKDENELQEVLMKDPTAALLILPENTADHWVGWIARMRRSPNLKNRRVVMGLPQVSQMWEQMAYALPSTGIWAPPYEAPRIAKLLLEPILCGG